MGSVFCGNIKLSLFGESHGGGIGVVIDGFPSGMRINREELAFHMKRRAPGGAYSTTRKERDEIEFVSGIKGDVTEGSPICMLIKNTDIRSADYDSGVFRPSHADYTGFVRYGGCNDTVGGGHFSGRLTAAMVMAGSLCRQFLYEKYKVNIFSHIKSIGNVNDCTVLPQEADLKELSSSDFPVLLKSAKADMQRLISEAEREGNSVGGSIECFAVGVKEGLGSPIVSGVESRLSALLFAVPAVKGVEFGKGFELCRMTGKEANDEIRCENGRYYTLTNNNGGILGGITNGMPVAFTVGIKPTPSIALKQKTADNKGGNIEYEIKGRHDPCIVPRAVPVIESVAAIVLLDLYLEAYGYANN